MISQLAPSSSTARPPRLRRPFERQRLTQLHAPVVSDAPGYHDTATSRSSERPMERGIGASLGATAGRQRARFPGQEDRWDALALVPVRAVERTHQRRPAPSGVPAPVSVVVLGGGPRISMWWRAAAWPRVAVSNGLDRGAGTRGPGRPHTCLRLSTSALALTPAGRNSRRSTGTSALAAHRCLGGGADRAAGEGECGRAEAAPPVRAAAASRAASRILPCPARCRCGV